MKKSYLVLSISARRSTSRIFFLAAADVTAPTSLFPIPAAVAEVRGIVLTSSFRSEFELELRSESELDRLRSRLL